MLASGLAESYDNCISHPFVLAIGDVYAAGDSSFHHVISIGVRPLRESSACRHTFVELDDTVDGDLLGVVDRCVAAFLDVSKGEHVLIHCHAGQSRSVGMCVAFLLVATRMRVGPITSLLLRSRRKASPNPSFRAQLRLLDALLHGEPSPLTGFTGGSSAAVVSTLRTWWSVLACPVSSTLPFSHRPLPWLDTISEESDEVELLHLRSQVEKLLEDAPHLLECLPSVDTMLTRRGGGQQYCCGRCNSVLFTDGNVTAVHRGSGAATQGVVARGEELRSCSLISVEPPASVVENCSGSEIDRLSNILPTMTPDPADPPPSHRVSGHLLCPRCRAKVGGWNWAGVLCACGIGLRPAIFAVLSRIIVRRPHVADDHH